MYKALVVCNSVYYYDVANPRRLPLEDWATVHTVSPLGS